MAGNRNTVNSVLPGPVRSQGVGDFVNELAEQQGQTFEEFEQQFFEKVRPTSLIKRFATAAEVAALVCYGFPLNNTRPTIRFFMQKALLVIGIFSSIGLSGCLSPLAISTLSRNYNESVASDLTEQLLLNIARAGNNEPILFTGISNIAATMNFQANVGATPALTGNSGTTLTGW